MIEFGQPAIFSSSRVEETTKTHQETLPLYRGGQAAVLCCLLELRVTLDAHTAIPNAEATSRGLMYVYEEDFGA